jgi:phage shock protein C
MMNRPDVRRLYRSRQNRMLAGVAGGIAEYFMIDATLVRVILFLALLPAGPLAPVVYVVLALVIPDAPLEQTPAEETPAERVEE